MPGDPVGPPVAEDWSPNAEEWSASVEEGPPSVEEGPPSAENEPPRAQRCHKEKCMLWIIAPGLLLALLLTSYILYASNVDPSISTDNEEWLKERVKSCQSEAPYAIDNPGCQLANFCPNSRDIAEFTNSSQFKEPWCEFKFSSEQPPLFEANATGLYLQPEVLERYDIADPLNAVNCCYWSMVPTIEPYERDFTEENYPIKCRSELCQNPPSLSNFCFPLQPWVAVPSNIHMLHLSCYRTDTPVVPIELYHDYFAFIRRDDEKLRARCEAAGTCDKREQLFNVMVVGVDAGSRLNFKRNLLETHEVLTKLLGAVELRGYNSVAKSSLASFASVAAGTELHETCWLQDAKSCPKSLWETFAERGFATALVEDPPLANPSIGFGTLRRSAVDNFGSPLIDEAVKARGHTEISGKKICAGPRDIAAMVLNYGVEFMAAHADHPYFGLLWLHSATEVEMNSLRLLDRPLAAALRQMHGQNLLERTIVAVVAGRGAGDVHPAFKTSAQGDAETKNPFAYIYLPKSFHKAYPLAVEALLNNAHRLTTPFDLHTTLQSLADPVQNLARYPAIHLDAVKPEVQPSNFHSEESKPTTLFETISPMRTCLHAGIQSQFCLCTRRTGLPTSNPNIRDMARRMVQVMNNVYLTTQEDCFWLQLNEVLYAEQVPNSVLKDKNSKTYFLNFNTWPDQMVFEGRFVLRPAIDKNPPIYSVNITNVLTTKLVLQADCVQALLDKKNVQQLILFERNWKPHGGK